MSESKYDTLIEKLVDTRHAIMSKEIDADVGWDLRDEVIALQEVLSALTQIVYEVSHPKHTA